MSVGHPAIERSPTVIDRRYRYCSWTLLASWLPCFNMRPSFSWEARLCRRVDTIRWNPRGTESQLCSGRIWRIFETWLDCSWRPKQRCRFRVPPNWRRRYGTFCLIEIRPWNWADVLRRSSSRIQELPIESFDFCDPSRPGGERGIPL